MICVFEVDYAFNVLNSTVIQFNVCTSGDRTFLQFVTCILGPRVWRGVATLWNPAALITLQPFSTEHTVCHKSSRLKSFHPGPKTDADPLLCAVLFRLLFRALYNTLHPTALLKSAKKDAVHSEYCRRMQRWNLSHSRGNRLPVYVENPGLESSMASVVSWPPSARGHTHTVGSHQQSENELEGRQKTADVDVMDSRAWH